MTPEVKRIILDRDKVYKRYVKRGTVITTTTIFVKLKNNVNLTLRNPRNLISLG